MRILRPVGRIWTILLGITVVGLLLGLALRVLVPLAPWLARPTLIAITPAPGEADVVPRSSISLRFSLPMNRRSVEAALQIDPPTSGVLRWNVDATELVFQPQLSLTPATSYTVSLSPTALGRWWQPMQPALPARFRTARLPSVVSALPGGGGVASTAPLALVFSQAMVDPQAVGQAATLPVLIDPPLPVAANWLDDRTVLLQPLQRMRPATSYTATLSPLLTDVRGIPLEQEVRWSWATAWPELLDRTPANEARQVGPRTPLTLTLAAPVELEQLRTALSITPAVDGTLVASTTVSGTQVITFTPTTGWATNQSYRVALANASFPSWRFTTSPEPGIVSLFPGQGQVLPADQALRLRFSTPMDLASLQANLQIEPPVGPFEMEVNAAEVRLLPRLAPSSSYTITIGADARDRNGTPLGTDYTLNLRTAPAAASLAIPAATERVVSLPISRTATIAISYTNLSALDLALYRLDEATLVRVLNFGANEWNDFRPERYGLQMQERWRVALNAAPDQALQATLPISQSDSPALLPGAYYLRARTSEGPRADLVVLVQPLLLGITTHNQATLVWAVDQAGQPAINQAITLYNGNAPIAIGNTGADGLYRASLPLGVDPANLLAVAANDAGIVRQRWLNRSPTLPASYASLLLPERTSYQAGESIVLSGFARRIDASGNVAMPLVGSPCRLQLRPLVAPTGAESGAIQSGSCSIDSVTGIVSASLLLDSERSPGSYLLRSTVGDSDRAYLVQVTPPFTTSDLLLTTTQIGTDQVELQATVAGTALANAAVQWQLHLVPLANILPTAGGAFNQQALPPITSNSGQGRTGFDGRLVIPLPQVLTRTMAYALDIVVHEAGGETGFVSTSGRLAGQNLQLGLRLPARALTSADLPQLQLSARDEGGAPRPNATISVALYRGSAVVGPPTLERRARTDSNGTASLELVQLTPGEYQVVARLDGAEVRDTLFVTRPGFINWNNLPGEVTLVPDRERYQIGDVARLLVTSPAPTGTALLSISRGTGTTAEVISVRAGTLLTVTITPDMAPTTRVGLLLTGEASLRSGEALLAVDAPPPALLGSLSAERATLPGGTSLPITFTAVTTSQVLFSIAPAESAPAQADLATMLRAGYRPPQGLARSRLPEDRSALELPQERLEPALGEPLLLLLEPQTLPAGQPLETMLPMPSEAGRWRITAYAAAENDRFLASSVLVTTTSRLRSSLHLPTLLRQGDRAIVALDLSNPGGEAQELSVQLNSNGAQVAFSTPARRQVRIGAGEQQQLTWEISAGSTLTATIALLLEQADWQREAFSSQLAISPRSETATSAAPGLAVVSQNYRDPLSGALLDPARLEQGQLVQIETTLIAAQPLSEVAVSVTLPGALRRMQVLTTPDFMVEELATNDLVYRAEELPAGMYQLGYLARVVAAGDYAAPGPEVRFGNSAVVGKAFQVTVQVGGRE
jgi:alpha-2-macroglobulin